MTENWFLVCQRKWKLVKKVMITEAFGGGGRSSIQGSGQFADTNSNRKFVLADPPQGNLREWIADPLPPLIFSIVWGGHSCPPPLTWKLLCSALARHVLIGSRDF
jgi:hypothetical protein